MRHVVRKWAAVAAACVMLVAGRAAAQEATQLKQDPSARIPRGARLYIAPIAGGYDIYLTAAIHEKQVPVVVVTDRARADYELSGVSESEKAGWAQMLFWGNSNSSEQASIKVVDLKNGTVVFGYNVNKSNSLRGKQSSSEACAKHLKDKIESGS